MPFTIRLHSKMPASHGDWKSQDITDRKGYAKYEEALASQERKFLIIKIITLSIFSLGFYYIYLKCTKSGKQELANLGNRKIIHYVKEPAMPKAMSTLYVQKSNSVPSKQEPSITSGPTHFKKEILRNTSADSISLFDSLDKLEWPLIEENLRKDPHFGSKLSQIVEDFTFSDSIGSSRQLWKLIQLLKKFARFDLLEKLRNTMTTKGIFEPIDPLRNRNPLNAEIMHIQREAILSLDGKQLPADGEPVDCVVLQGIDGKRYGVKIVPDSVDIRDKFFVLVVKKNGIEKEVCVQPEEFAERLQLDPRSLGQTRNLTKYVEEQNISLVLANYQRLFEKQQKHHSEGLEPHLLMKVIKVAYLKLGKLKAYGERTSPALQIGLPLSGIMDEQLDVDLKKALGERKIVVGFKGDKAFLRDITKRELIGKGGAGEVFKICSIASQKGKAMKTVTFGANEEAKIVDKLHEGYSIQEKGFVPGIVKPFHGVVNFGKKVNSTTGSEEFGILDTLYVGDLESALGLHDKPEVFKGMSEKLEAFYKVLVGLEHCVIKKGLLHQDIKPKNIFYRHNNNTGKIDLYLGDFGSAQLVDVNHSFNPADDKAFTPNFVPKADYWERYALATQLRAIDDPESREKYIQHCRRWDIFSLGCVLVKLLVPKQPYFKYESGPMHPIPDTFDRKVLVDANIPQEICDLIETMLQKDPSKRPSIETVREIYANALKKHGLSLSL